jgi:thiosulfate sulfurtransferase
MSQFKELNVTEAQQLIETQGAVLVDIRDEQSFAALHATNSYRLTNENMATFMDDVGFEQPVLVICYHGVSSQGAAQYLVNLGYETVYSIKGGFSAWSLANLPVESR